MNATMQTPAVKLLLADDEAAIRRGIAVALAARSLEADETSSGEGAVTLLRNWPADVVLPGVNMPGMGGVESCGAREQSAGESIANYRFTSSIALRAFLQVRICEIDNRATAP